MNLYSFVKFALLFLFSAGTIPPSSSPDCSKIKHGQFFFYPEGGKFQFKLIRKDSLQLEIDLKTMDTSVWRVFWVDDCTLTNQFISSTKPIDAGFLDFVSNHKAYQQIEEIRNDYYLIKMSLDSINSSDYMRDTVWFKPKAIKR